MKKTILVLGTAALLVGGASCTHGPQPLVGQLRLEMKENPLAVDSHQPRFSWRLSSDRQDLRQLSYHIQVAATPEQLAAGKDLLWDSGQQTSEQSLLVPYDGPSLAPEQAYYWRVKLTTNQGETDWSQPAYWTTAPANAMGKAIWIGENALSNPGENPGTAQDPYTRLAARYLRKEFQTGKNIQRAYLFISGVGSYEAYLNGERVSNDIFAPMPSVYNERVYYNTYDVTQLVKQGENAIGVALGNGRFFTMRNPGMINYGLPRLIARLQIEYTDQSSETIITDDSWRVTSQGPILANNEFDGEEYDARREMPGWNKTGFDDSSWKKVDEMEAPEGGLVAQQNPNIQVQDTIRPIGIFARPDGSYLVDMGQNMVGWLAVRLKGNKGEPVELKHAELLQADSSLYLANLRTARVTDIYTPAADGTFEWKPAFVYHGFRYATIKGLKEKPSPEDIQGHVIYDKMATTGHFTSSNPLLDRIHKNAFWGIRGNYRGMPTDCPQRDERLGWLGDRTTGAYGEAFLLDNAQLYTKWLQDIEDSMSPEGSISDVSPYYWTLHSDNVTWPAAFFCVADMLYKQYGDLRPIEKHYAAMRRWMQHMESVAMKDYIIVKDTYGDWCMPPESQQLIHSQDPARKTDGAILSTTVYYDLLGKMAHFAELIGKKEDVAGYRQLAERMKEAYNKKFFDPATARYGNNTVTANILSLRLGLVPAGYEQRVFDNIVQKTEQDFGGHVSTGVLGIQHLMRGLTEHGRTDLAYRIVTNRDYPSWGYMIDKGATTIWELWNGDTADPAMNSANHVMLLGDLLIWYYEDLAGIACHPGYTAYKRLLMAPAFPDGLNEVNATYDSPYGKIASAWQREGDALSWDIQLPGNTTAVVRVPKRFQMDVQEQEGLRKLPDEGGDYVSYELASGTYHLGK